MMVAVAVVALVLGMLVACLRWFLYVLSTANCFNETGAPLSDVRVSFSGGERNADLLIDPDPSGRSGFVRLSPRPNAPGGRRNGLFHNLNFDLQLRDKWWYECED
jgi:hypothetical protein